jgi:multidrug efflux system outer membrane protein
MRRHWLLLTLLFAPACAVGPNYKRPAVIVPETVRGAPAPTVEAAGAGEAASLADRPWWEIFGDETLQSLIDDAIRSNYDIRTAAWRVEEFRARAGIARSEFYPQIQYGGGWTRGRESEFVQPSLNPTRNLQAVNLTLSWEIDVWGRIRRLNESARAEYLATEEGRRGVLLSVVSDTAGAYFALRELDARLAIARRTTEAFRGTYELFDLQRVGGVASELEVSRAEAALAAAAATVPDLERQIVAQENLICFLIGRNPEPIPRGAGLTEQRLPPEVPVGLPSTLLERRPDVRQVEERLVSANARVGVATANFFPKIALTGSYGGASPDIADLFHAGRMWSIAAGLAGPVFQGGRLRNEYDAEMALFEQARVQYESVVTRAFGEVSTALTAYQSLAAAERQQARSVGAYQESVELANIRYTAGLSSYVEVLDAEQLLFPEENTLARMQLVRLDALVALYRALGGGWNLENPTWARPASQASVVKP